MRASRVVKAAIESGEANPGLLEQAFIELWAAFPSARREMRRVVAAVAEAFNVRLDRDELEPGRLLEKLAEAALDAVPSNAGEAQRRRVARALASRILYLALDTLVMELGVGLGE